MSSMMSSVQTDVCSELVSSAGGGKFLGAHLKSQFHTWTYQQDLLRHKPFRANQGALWNLHSVMWKLNLTVQRDRKGQGRDMGGLGLQVLHSPPGVMTGSVSEDLCFSEMTNQNGGWKVSLSFVRLVDRSPHQLNIFPLPLQQINWAVRGE